MRWRRVRFHSEVNFFKPMGVPRRDLEEVTLKSDEVEAMRLLELEGKTQEECAKMMEISQPTFNRIINKARKKIADAIINGKVIVIEGNRGGSYNINKNRINEDDYDEEENNDYLY